MKSQFLIILLLAISFSSFAQVNPERKTKQQLGTITKVPTDQYASQNDVIDDAVYANGKMYLPEQDGKYIQAMAFGGSKVKKRVISTQEYQFALSLFPREFPEQYQITITNLVSNGAYFVRPAIDGGILLNIGKLFDDCLQNKAIFAHELTHVWQIRHFGIPWYIKEFIQNHVFCSTSPYPYTCVESKKLGDYNAEQQAEIIKDYYRKLPCPTKIATSALSSNTWQIMIGSDAKDVAVNSNGQVFIVNSAGRIYQYGGVSWQQLPGSDARSISSNANKTCMVNSAGRIYSFQNNAWAQMPGSDGRDIAINSDGSIWLVNTAGRIYKYNGTAWTQMSGSAGKRIAAGGGQVWLINTQGEIYKFNGSTWNHMPGSDGRDIAVSNDGKIWLTNTSGEIYQWNGQGWNQLDGGDGNTLSANNQKMYMVNTAGRIYYRTY